MAHSEQSILEQLNNDCSNGVCLFDCRPYNEISVYYNKSSQTYTLCYGYFRILLTPDVSLYILPDNNTVQICANNNYYYISTYTHESYLELSNILQVLAENEWKYPIIENWLQCNEFLLK